MRFGRDEVLKGGDAAGACRVLLDFIDAHSTQPQSEMQTEAPGKRSEDSHPGREGNQEPESDGGAAPVL
jgi:hypothetical protein